MIKGGGMGESRAIAPSIPPPPPLSHICELGGLASHCADLGTLACNTTHIYLNIKADIYNNSNTHK